MTTEAETMSVIMEGINAFHCVCELNGIKILLKNLTERSTFEAAIILKIFMLDAEWKKHQSAVMETEEWRNFLEKHGKGMLAYTLEKPA